MSGLRSTDTPATGSRGAGELRALREGDREQAWALGTLAFGGDPAAALPPPRAGVRSWGVFDGERLLATAALRSDAQWWGGRPVKMGGLAGVAVHPDARGRGAATRLVRELIAQMRRDGQAVSALYPTAPGIYRPRGWEVVGSLDETVLPSAALRGAGDPLDCRVRTAGPDDRTVLAGLYRAYAEGRQGMLTREGPLSPRGAEPVLGHDVVALAELDGRPVGYLAYDRGRGYGPGAQLRVAELVAVHPAATAALLRSVASWDAVTPAVRWCGPVDELALLLPAPVPPPDRAQPWMLRIVDAPAALAARGYPAGCRTRASFELVDPEVPEHEGGWTLTVEDGSGRLERAPAGRPRLHVRGLALLYAGAADTALLRRAGLLEDELPELDGWGGAPARLLDYF